ncbi:MAG: trypsin-like peptidase domain-containing protein [Gemmatimonadetes bacterium]|nr:trypsin-like peptidase domain-containing protein [Gemmatimonadota bacterium]
MADLRLTSPPYVLVAAFRSLTSVGDLATLLQVRPDQLRHYTYGRGYRYRAFTIKKRRGGVRTLKEPHSGLKIVQQKLAQVLTTLYEAPDCVHGFVAGRSIATNAHLHIGSEWVFNVDLKDFFPSINFGRVRGLFIKRYGLPANVATVIARICTHKNELPQGAPSSPIVSNMVAERLDRDLQRLARRYRSAYTRYADDLTFSRNDRFPDAIGYWDPIALPVRQSRVGHLLEAAVMKNGFEINPAKVHLRLKDERQVVTGLVVNRKVNVRKLFVRRIRAMLHAWETHGEKEAEQEYFNRYDTKDRAPHAIFSFRRVVKGHIDFLGMIRGTDHSWYRRFVMQYAHLVPGYVARPEHCRRPNHLRTWKDAIWVLETEESQGTAFELTGYGLVTAAHVVRDTTLPGHPPYSNPHVFSPRNEALKHPVRIAAYDADLDLAILEFDAPTRCALRTRMAPAAVAGDPIRAAGFPSYAPGSQLWEESGWINHVRRHITAPRYVVTTPIIAGASGSPVMDLEGRVIGVATTGVLSFSAAAARSTGAAGLPDYGVVPIALLARVSVAATPASFSAPDAHGSP